MPIVSGDVLWTPEQPAAVAPITRPYRTTQESVQQKFAKEQSGSPQSPLEKFPQFPAELRSRFTDKEWQAVQKWNNQCSEYFRRERTRGSR